MGLVLTFLSLARCICSHLRTTTTETLSPPLLLLPLLLVSFPAGGLLVVHSTTLNQGNSPQRGSYHFQSRLGGKRRGAWLK